MARNRSSKFGAADGLFPEESSGEYKKEDTHEEHNVQYIHEGHQVQEEHEEQLAHDVHDDRIEIKTIGSTQGRKGMKLKRINLAFDDLNYDYVRIESRRRGQTITEFVNFIIEKYRLSSHGKISDNEIR